MTGTTTMAAAAISATGNSFFMFRRLLGVGFLGRAPPDGRQPPRQRDGAGERAPGPSSQPHGLSSRPLAPQRVGPPLQL